MCGCPKAIMVVGSKVPDALSSSSSLAPDHLHPSPPRRKLGRAPEQPQFLADVPARQPDGHGAVRHAQPAHLHPGPPAGRRRGLPCKHHMDVSTARGSANSHGCGRGVQGPHQEAEGGPAREASCIDAGRVAPHRAAVRTGAQSTYSVTCCFTFPVPHYSLIQAAACCATPIPQRCAEPQARCARDLRGHHGPAGAPRRRLHLGARAGRPAVGRPRAAAGAGHQPGRTDA